MKCKIEYVGKSEDGISQYYCTNHKALASDEKGNKLEECLCTNKEQFDDSLDLRQNKIESIKVIYHNILDNVVPDILVNNNLFKGVLVFENSVLNYKDLGGMMLAKINHISLENVKCNYCNHYHSDNGKFAYTPHRTHLCQYCGHLFRVQEKNIGNELAKIFDIPDIQLEDKEISIENVCQIEYDLLKGELLVNHQKVNRLIIQNKTVSIVDFLNNALKDEF